MTQVTSKDTMENRATHRMLRGVYKLLEEALQEVDAVMAILETGEAEDCEAQAASSARVLQFVKSFTESTDD